MKKAILISFICGIAMMFSSFAMADHLLAPKWNDPWVYESTTTPTTEEDPKPTVCFDWGVPADESDSEVGVPGAVKYSVDIEFQDVVVTYPDKDNPDETITETIDVEFSFGTGDRDDGNEMGDPYLCVLKQDLLYDTDGDGLLDPIYGEAFVKVKALAPGKGKGRQNHPFSETRIFRLTEPDPI